MPNVGEEVSIHCTGTLTDGRVICDTLSVHEPITFVVGSSTL